MSKIKDTIEDKEKEENEELDFQHSEWLETTNRNATIRIPCDQYAFIEVAVHETPINTIELYRYYSKLYTGGDGIPDKEFNDYLDCYLSKDKPIGSEVYAAMNREQQHIIQTIKRSLARMKRRSDE